MASNRLGRRISAAVGGAAILAMIGFTAACSSESDEAPETSTTTTTTTTEAELTPTENKPNPSGTNIFTPPVVAPEQTVNPSNR